MNTCRRIILLCFLSSILGCSAQPERSSIRHSTTSHSIANDSTINKSSTSLYQQLGGESGLERLVDNFIEQIAYDERIFPFFAQANVERFRSQFIQHICDLSDGPCQYTGDSMIDIHTGMSISEADFNRLVELLIDAMEATEIPYPVQNRLLARLAPLRSEIIHR